jgi:hypothetical protein
VLVRHLLGLSAAGLAGLDHGWAVLS